jgi:carbon-monoxide dehydrogenase iron sulfur subunit
MTLDKETGLVVHDAEKCIGCWTCIMVCPYGAIKPDTLSKIVVKCDLCPNLEVPACVANCPNEALVCEEVEQ